MEVYKKFLGNLNKSTGIVLDYFFSIIIFIVSFLVNIFSSIRDLLFVGGCLIFFIILNPLVFFRPITLVIVFFLFLFPLLGRIAVSWLEYTQYMVTEYFYEKADFYLLEKKPSFDKMGSYGQRYKRMQERKRQEEAESRRRQQQAEWEDFFNNFSGGGFYWDINDRTQGGGYSGSSQNQGPQGYTGMGFVQKYEDSCAVLGVPNDADKYAVKLAYRKLAKQYHPDINKSAGATEMFQKIGDAYEFLSDSNISKYKSLNKNRQV